MEGASVSLKIRLEAVATETAAAFRTVKVRVVDPFLGGGFPVFGDHDAYLGKAAVRAPPWNREPSGFHNTSKSSGTTLP